MHNLQYGALFGLFCYATFELTNIALLKHWEWAVVVPDNALGRGADGFRGDRRTVRRLDFGEHLAGRDA
jgi:hypothetical protein